MSGLQDKIQEVVDQQGWDDNTVLGLALTYIENQQDDETFTDFLDRIASEENGGAAPIKVPPIQTSIEATYYGNAYPSQREVEVEVRDAGDHVVISVDGDEQELSRADAEAIVDWRAPEASPVPLVTIKAYIDLGPMDTDVRLDVGELQEWLSFWLGRNEWDWNECDEWEY